MQLRDVAVVGLLGLGLGWTLAGRFQEPSVAPAGRGSSVPRPLGTAPTAVAPLTEQLRLRLEQKPRPPRTERNPFVFGSRRSLARAPAASARDSQPLEPAPEPVAAPPGAQLRLAGMASTTGSDGPEWTAMIHDGQGLLYVKQGDTLPGGFAVVDVQETSVTLRDGTGGERTLRLR